MQIVADEVEAERERVSLTILAEPSRRRWSRRIEVYVDDMLVGFAPIEVGVESGVHTIRWYREDRLDHTCTVEIGAEGSTVGIEVANPLCP